MDDRTSSSSEADRVASLFANVLELPQPERQNAIDTLLADDPRVGAEVASLVEAHEAAGGYLRAPEPSERAALLAFMERDGTAGRRVGSYSLLHEIGHGGMGVVFLAERSDGEFDQQVALKVLPGALANDLAVARFVRERQILAQLSHRNIARLVDGGMTDEGLPFFAMEYVEGDRLTDFCEEHGLSVAERLELFREVCEAVSYAHQRLVVHRDLKPSNVLVTAEGRVKLLDFGIAKLLDESGEGATLTSGAQALTPEYAAPEQIRGEAPSTATDVYGLGVLLYEILATQRPLEGLSGEALRRAALQVDPAPPSAVCPPEHRRAIEGDLDVIVLKALRKEPDRRYSAVETLSEDIRRHLDGLPVRARPATRRYRLAKFVTRHRVGTVATSLVVLSLLVGAGVAFWQADQKVREAQKTERMSDFLTELFREADPFRGGEQIPSFEAFLDSAVVRLDERLADDEEVRAEMLQVIGKVFVNLERPQKAEPLLAESVDIRRRVLSAGHPDLATSLLELGRAQMELGELDRARALFAEAEQIRREVFGPESLETAESVEELSDLAYELGELETVEKLDRQVLTIRRATLGPDDPLVATSLNNLAVLAGRLGRLEEAESLHREALTLRLDRFGREHPDVAQSWNNLASTLDLQGRVMEAREAIEEALAIREVLFGQESTVYANSLGSRGVLDLTRGAYDEAIASLSRSADLFRASVGEGHWRVGYRMHYLGIAQLRLGIEEEGLANMRSGLSEVEATFGVDHWRPAIYRSNLARELALLARPAEAVPLIESALAILRVDEGPGRIYLAPAEAALGVVQGALGESGAAEEAFATAIGLQAEAGRAGHATTAEILSARGRLRLARDSVGPASEDFLRSREIRLTLFGPGNNLHVASQLDVAETLIGAGDLAGARDLLAAVAAALGGSEDSYGAILEERRRRLLAIAG